MSANPSPPCGLLPHLIVRGGAAAIAFYRRAFAAELLFELAMPDGRLGHAEMSIGPNRFMLADEFPEMQCVSPIALAGSPVTLSLYVDDVDAVAKRAVDAGAKLDAPIKDEFYGDRVAMLHDPFGHKWTLHTRIEDVSVEEMRSRMQRSM